MIHKNLNPFFITFFFFLLISQTLSVENKIIVKLDNQIITSLELKNKIRTNLILSNQEISQKNIDKVKSIALNALINFKIKEFEVKKYGVEKNEKDLLNQLISISKNDISNFKKIFDDNNLNYDFFKKEVETEIAWRKLIFNLYNSKVVINEKEIEEQLKQIRIESKINEINISEISISFENDEEKKQKIFQTNQLIESDGFEKTAIRLSESPTSSQGGNLGWINAKSVSKKLFKILEKMEINDISDPIISLNEVLFLKLVGKRTRNISNKDLNNLKNDLIQAKKNELFNLYSKSHLSKIKNGALIEYK